jgi:hypothetical protein
MLLIAIVVLMLLIIVGCSFILNPPNNGDNEQKGINEQEFVEETKRPVDSSHISNFGELKKTSNPNFKVGEKYFYYRWKKTTPDTENTIYPPEDYNTVVEVRGIERRNNSDYYMLESKNVSVNSYILTKDESGVWKKRQGVSFQGRVGKDENGTEIREITRGTAAIYEGGVLGVNENNGEVTLIKSSISPVLEGMYGNWMLYLDKGIKWVEKQNISPRFSSDNQIINIEWVVADVEKVNSISCFKVIVTTKTEVMGISGKKISSEVITYWIDENKRVLVKMERKEDNILTETIELKEYELA